MTDPTHRDAIGEVMGAETDPAVADGAAVVAAVASRAAGAGIRHRPIR